MSIDGIPHCAVSTTTGPALESDLQTWEAFLELQQVLSMQLCIRQGMRLETEAASYPQTGNKVQTDRESSGMKGPLGQGPTRMIVEMLEQDQVPMNQLSNGLAVRQGLLLTACNRAARKTDRTAGT